MNRRYQEQSMNWDFAQACYYEAKFCAKHYNADEYWRTSTIDKGWYECYQMGNEI